MAGRLDREHYGGFSQRQFVGSGGNGSSIELLEYRSCTVLLTSQDNQNASLANKHAPRFNLGQLRGIKQQRAGTL